MSAKSIKPTKSGVKAALLSMGYTNEPEYMPPALLSIQSSDSFTGEEMEWAKYLVFDNDFGGAWSDAAQINMHLS